MRIKEWCVYLAALVAIGGFAACSPADESLETSAPSSSTSEAKRPTSTTTPPDPSAEGLDCAPGESVLTMSATQAGDTLSDPPATAEDAARRFNEREFPRGSRDVSKDAQGSERSAEGRTRDEFVVRDSAGKRQLVMVVEEASNGYRVSGFQACSSYVAESSDDKASS